MKQLNIGLYARVSKQDQNLQTQLLALRDYCQRENLEIAKEYLDKGISGASNNRPSFNRMLEDVRSGKINLSGVLRDRNYFIFTLPFNCSIRFI